jgi:hypothetical protein
MKLTPQQIVWLKGAEFAIVGGVTSAALQALSAGQFPRNKAGWIQFGIIVVGSGYGALKLYMAQSPVQNVLVVQQTTDTLKTADATATKTDTVTTNIPPVA